MNEDIDDITIARYFLVELSEPEMTRIEIAYFRDSALFGRILAVEKNLISRYLSGEMRAKDRESFERHFLQNPERRKRVDDARSLSEGTGTRRQHAQQGRGPRWWRGIVERFRNEGR